MKNFEFKIFIYLYLKQNIFTKFKDEINILTIFTKQACKKI